MKQVESLLHSEPASALTNVSQTEVRGISVVSAGPHVVSEEKALQKLYQTLNE
jgi:hypothetical protein